VDEYTEEINIAKFITGGFLNLFSARIIARIIGFIGGLIVIRLLTSYEYGLIVMAVAVPGIFGLFGDWGVSAATVKFLSEYRAKGNFSEAKSVFYVLLFFRFILSLILSILCFLFSDLFAMFVFQKPDIAPVIRTASLMVLAYALYGVGWNAFLGLGRTKCNSYMIVASELLRAILAPLFVILGYQAVGVVLGYSISLILVALASIFALLKFFLYINGSSKTYFKTLKDMLRYGFPLSLGGIITTGMGHYYSILIGVFSTSSNVGNYGAASRVSMFIGFLSMPIMTILFPAFSRLDIKTQFKTVSRLYRYSVIYSTLLIVPTAVISIILAKPLVYLLVGPKYELAWFYFQLLCIGWLFYGLGHVVSRNLLSGIGETKIIAKLDILSSTLGALMATILVPIYDIPGLIISTWMSTILSSTLMLKLVQKKCNIGFPIGQIFKVYVASLFATVITSSLIHLWNHNVFGILMEIVLTATIFYVLTLFSVMVLGVIREKEIIFLQQVFKDIPYLGKAVCIFLKLLTRFARK